MLSTHDPWRYICVTQLQSCIFCCFWLKNFFVSCCQLHKWIQVPIIMTIWILVSQDVLKEFVKEIFWMTWVVTLFLLNILKYKNSFTKNSQFRHTPWLGKMTAKSSVFLLVSVFYVFMFILKQYFGREWSWFHWNLPASFCFVFLKLFIKIYMILFQRNNLKGGHFISYLFLLLVDIYFVQILVLRLRV